MNLNDAFSVSVTFKPKDGALCHCEWAATEFFDADVQSDYSEQEWDCDLPWEKLAIEEYLDERFHDRRNLEWLQIDVKDRRHEAHRRIRSDYWNGHVLTCEWTGLASATVLRQMILEVSESEPTKFQILKLSVDDTIPRIISHSRHSLNDDDNVEWLHILKVD